MTHFAGQLIFKGLAVTLSVAALFAQSGPPVFYGREVIGVGTTVTRSSVSVPKSNPSFDQAHRKAYEGVEPDKSLLLHDCGTPPSWCEDPAFSFVSVMKVASRFAELKLDAVMKQWVKTADPELAVGPVPYFRENLRSGMNDAFHLLAIVNRMDLGKWHAGTWQGAEVRFVYGLKGTQEGAAPAMTVILEFVVDRMNWPEFHAAARKWHALKETASPAFPKELRKALGHYLHREFSKVRLRTNSSLARARTWHLGQWEFSKHSFRQTPMDDQIRENCIYDPSHDPACAAYIEIWKKATKAYPFRTWPIPTNSPILAQVHPYAPVENYGMPTPPGVCPSESPVRNVLSLQQCSFCHANETRTEFMHIRNRKVTERKAELSPFLKGGKPKPAYNKVRPGNAAMHSHEVKVRGVCLECSSCRGKEITITRYYHDLARRALFLAAVLITPPSKSPDKLFLSQLERYLPDFTH